MPSGPSGSGETWGREEPVAETQVRSSVYSGSRQRYRRRLGSVVCEVDIMVKLLRACVWMPRRKKAMKDVDSCEKLRGAASGRDPEISEWGNPTGANTCYVHLNT